MTNIFNYSGTIQTWAVPNDGRYKIEAYGAQGGSLGSLGGSYHQGGKGAYVSGEFDLKVGEVLFILVGGAGQSKAWNDWGGGGGGGTFVAKSTLDTTYKLLAGFSQYVTPLIVAGGGGGAGDDSCSNIGNGQTQPGYGGLGRSTTTSEGCGTTSSSVGGAGFATNGSGGATPPYSFLNGGAAGTWNYNGGFGGGGAPYDGGGGGGGWHGGDSPGNNTGMGGYSYNTGVNPRGIDGARSGNGLVAITSITENKTSIYDFSFTGGKQEWIVPVSGTYKLECWGASGGIGYGNGNPKGLGGYSCGEIKLKAGEKLYIYIGEDGVNTITSTSFNGGGSSFSTSGHNGGRGGGASDIRRGADDFNHRVIVAGGGGGAQPTCGGSSTTAGHGGGLTGTRSYNQAGGYAGSYANGGSQTAGGTSGNVSGQWHTNGSFGAGANSQTCGAGGGGGWYGGGATYTAGGGGGSSYIGTLENSLTIAGNASMPNAFGGTQTGQDGNGAIVITLLQLELSAMTYAVLTEDGEYFIPNRSHYDFEANEFIPVTMDYMKDYVNNYHKFIYDITELNKRIYIDEHTSFLPFQKINMKNARICRIESTDKNYTNSNFFSFINYKSGGENSIIINYQISCKNIDKSIITFEYSQDDNYDDNFIDVGISNTKVLFEHRNRFYGKDLKETVIGNILIDGIDGEELDSYKVHFLGNFKVHVAFKNNTVDVNYYLKQILFHTKEFQTMQRLTDQDFTVYRDRDNDRIFIKSNKDVTNLLVKKLENTEIQYDESIETF